MVDIKVPALEKLVDYTASGIGAVAGPILLPWRAYFEGKANRISARADADVRSIQASSEAESLPIIAAAQAEARRYLMSADADVSGAVDITRDDVAQRIEFQEQKRLANIRDFVAGAAEILGDKEIADHEPDHDWTARFFDYAQDVTSEGLKQIWARILAGEVESPGRTSLRTLSILKDMSQRDAQIFNEIMEYAMGDFILINYYEVIAGASKVSEFMGLVNISLINPLGTVARHITLDSNGKAGLPHHGYALIIEGPADTTLQLMNLSTAALTTQGEELYAFCEHEPNLQYLSLFAGWLAERDCTLSMAPINSMCGNKMMYSSDAVQAIEPIKSS